MIIIFLDIVHCKFFQIWRFRNWLFFSHQVAGEEVSYSGGPIGQSWSWSLVMASPSPNHIVTSGQSVSPSWCQARFVTHDQNLQSVLTFMGYVVIGCSLWWEVGSFICQKCWSLSHFQVFAILHIYITYRKILMLYI
jgi:hypothetical protein